MRVSARHKFIERILLTGDTAGGVWTFATDLASGLASQGVEVLLATFGPTVSDSQRREAQSIPGLVWRHHFSKLEWMEDPWADLAGARAWLAELADAFHPDLVHLNTLCHADALSPRAPVVLTAHSSVSAWWAAVRRSPLPAVWKRYEKQVGESLLAATVITAPSKAALTQLQDHYRVGALEAIAIYNGRDPDVFQPGRKESFVLAAGRLWDDGKNIGTLAGVASQLRWPVYLAGNATGPSNKEVSFAGCHLLGELSNSELAGWYARASIFVSPAIYEPFGLSVLEAGLSGCPLVLGDIESFREIWRDAAIYVAPDSARALKRAIDSLISNDAFLEQMSHRAQERAAKFSTSRMLAGYWQAYESAIAIHSGVSRRQACAS